MKSFLHKSKIWSSSDRLRQTSPQRNDERASDNTADSPSQKRTVSPLEELPYEILEQILVHLVSDSTNKKELYKTLYALSATSKCLRNVVPNSKLYQTVILFNKKQALRFYKTISKPKTSQNSQFVETVCFVQPKLDTGSDVEMDNTGYSFNASSSNTNEKSWPDLTMDIMSNLPNLTQAIFDEVGPHFTYPTSVESTKSCQVMTSRKTPLSVYFAPESGWNRNLKADTLWPLGRIDKLNLSSIIIDDESVSKGNVKPVEPLNGPCCSASELVLSGCWLRCSPNSLMSFFGNVQSLILENLRDEGEILWIHCFPKLKHLTLKLVGRTNNRKPRNELLYPIALVPHLKRERNYSNIGVRDSIELGNIGKIVRNIIGPLRSLESLAISIPSICMVPLDDAEFDPSIDLYRHLDTLCHLKSLTLIIACLPDSYTSLPQNDLEWERALPESLLKSTVNLTIKFYNSKVVYQRSANSN